VALSKKLLSSLPASFNFLEKLFGTHCAHLS